jgi:hypothetical protein
LVGCNSQHPDGFLSLRAFKPSSSESADRGRSIIQVIVTVCVFVRHLFSFYPFYFDFHSARIIFDVSSGFYLWNINQTTA